VIDRSFRLNIGFIFILSLIFSACGGSSSVVSDSSSQSAKPAASPSAQTSEASAAAPTAPAPAVSGKPSPTPNPIIKQAAAQPGVLVPVPDSVKRPLNAEEMQKALQQMPPEVRQRIMGMQKLPTPSPQPTKK
jgi:hypothetical protein